MYLQDVEIRKLMSEHVETVQSDDTIGYALLKMISHRFRRFPITEGDKVVGILTSTDILQAIHEANTIQVLEKDVSDFMTVDVITANVNQPLDDILQIMADNRVSCIPLLQDGKLTGIFTNKDLMLFNIFWRELPTIMIKQDNPKLKQFDDEMCVYEEAKISEAIEKILTSGSKDIVLRDKDHEHIGWITTQRVLRSIATTLIKDGLSMDYLDQKIISRVVTTPIIDLELPIKLHEIVNVMNKRGLESVPLKSDNQYVKVITENIVIDLALHELL